MGLNMVQKSLHTADFGLHRTIFGLLMVRSWFTQSLTKVYTNQEKKFTQSLHNFIFLRLHRVYTQFTRPIQACKPRVNHE
jgi:hypothetical protein